MLFFNVHPTFDVIVEVAGSGLYFSSAQVNLQY